MLGDGSLQALHDYRRQGDGSVIVQAVYGRFLGNGDDGGGLQTCGDGGMCQGVVEESLPVGRHML